MPAPNEVVASPLTIYLADVGTAFPALDDLEADFDPDWITLGTEGDNNYDDSGVQFAHSETVNDFTPAGSTMPTKRFRTAENFLIRLNLVDISPEMYALVMNDAAVTSVAAGSGTPGQKHFSLFRGIQVPSFAVLARGQSSVNNDMNLQYEISKAFVSINGDLAFNKGTPTALPVEIMAIKHSTGDLIQVRIQTADAT